jgi:hypothetical protein
MAKRAAKEKLTKSKLITTHWWWQPFTEEELSVLTKKVRKFAVTNDSEQYYLWGSN